MSSLYERRLDALAGAEQASLLTKIQRGIEKESLRISAEGRLSQTPHPPGLGSALTHHSITTDYSEALMEFITPVSTDIDTSLATLEDVHRYTYSQLNGEVLWAASMPCVVESDDQIPVARYGSSNIARMKTVYRYGLGHRYGRLMQTIAGIHYNFSMPEDWWVQAHASEGSTQPLGDFITERYLGLIRNFRRWCWLLIYLFGASPAVCASFFRGSDHHGLEPFDEQGRSLYMPHGTALRMGDLGYTSNAQKNLAVCYNDLESYIRTLKAGITQPHPEYVDIGIGEHGHERQLNTSLLQIENEFYSPIRPKRVARSGETPLGALRRGGIEYVEVRCIDVNPYLPVGIDADQARFIDTFLLFCLLQDSPPCDEPERVRMADNLLRVVNRGREPGLELLEGSGTVPMATLAHEALDAMADLAGILDGAHGDQDYREVVAGQRRKIEDPSLTPSARMLAEMREQNITFFRLAMQASSGWAKHFASQELDPETRAAFQQESAASLDRQREVEAADNEDFESFLKHFYQQYEEL